VTHYCVIRADLPVGIMAAMLIHAAGESSPGDLPPDTYAIALCVPDEAAMLDLERRLVALGVAHVAVREPDDPWSGQLMALGLRPARRSAIGRALSSLPLLREERLRKEAA
jgi:hypothetical protein